MLSRKASLLIILLLFSAVSCFAQGQRLPEIFVGYSNLQAEGLRRGNPNSASNDFFDRRGTLHGVNAGATFFPFEMFSVTGDLSFNRKGRSFEVSNGSDSENTDVWYFLVGPSYVAPASGIVEPFLRILAGVAHTSYEASSERNSNSGTLKTSFDLGTTDFAMAFGGGIDLRVHERFKVRIIQVDYAPVFLSDRALMVLGQAGVLRPLTLSSQRQDNLRFSVGIVF